MSRFDDVNAEARRRRYRAARRKGATWLCPDCGTSLAKASLKAPLVQLVRGLEQDSEGAWSRVGGRGRNRGRRKGRAIRVVEDRFFIVRANQPLLVRCWNCPNQPAFWCEYDAAAIEQENAAGMRRLLRRHVEQGERSNLA